MIGLYFSGTGNSKYALERFMKFLNENTIFPIEKTDLKAIEDNDTIIFAYPIYYSNLPKIVKDFIVQNIELWKDKKIYIISTMGLFSGDGAGLAARLFRKYKAHIIGGLHVRMPDCIGDVKTLLKTIEENKQIIIEANELIDDAAKRLFTKPTKNGLSVLSHIIGLFGQRLYFREKVKNYTQNPKIDEKCSGCGKCAKSCPMNNISIIDNKAIPGNKCTMCYRCFSNCPNKAITILGKEVMQQIKTEKFI